MFYFMLVTWARTHPDPLPGEDDSLEDGYTGEIAYKVYNKHEIYSRGNIWEILDDN